MKKYIPFLTQILLFVFLGLGLFLAWKEKDIILAGLVSFVFVAGTQSVKANQEFGKAIEAYKKKVEELR